MTPHFLRKELNFPPEDFLWANSKKKFLAWSPYPEVEKYRIVYTRFITWLPLHSATVTTDYMQTSGASAFTMPINLSYRQETAARKLKSGRYAHQWCNTHMLCSHYTVLGHTRTHAHARTHTHTHTHTHTQAHQKDIILFFFFFFLTPAVHMPVVSMCAWVSTFFCCCCRGNFEYCSLTVKRVIHPLVDLPSVLALKTNNLSLDWVYSCLDSGRKTGRLKKSGVLLLLY